jgi:transposase InsO family protein
MSRKGNCWDNAVAESFFSSLKKERIKKQICKNRELGLADVADYIDTFYNRTRRHSPLGGVAKRCPLNPGNSTPLANKTLTLPRRTMSLPFQPHQRPSAHGS